MNNAPILLTEREVGKLLRMGRTALYEGRQETPPRIPFVAIGRIIRYPLADLPIGVQNEYWRARNAAGISVGMDEQKAA